MLSIPVKTLDLSAGRTKSSSSLGSIKYVHASMQGYRKYQEDAHISHIDDLGSAAESACIFGVLDGHGGDATAKSAAKIGMEVLLKNMSSSSSGDKENVGVWDNKRFTSLYEESFRVVDTRILRERLDNGSGCTSNLVIINGSTISCGNLGDSRSVLCRGGTVVPLSRDHKPDDAGEVLRIRKAGGNVMRGRVCGVVAVSR